MEIMTQIDTTCNQAETFAERCYRLGEEDGLEGIDMRGSEYALIGSDAWNSYVDGYAVGTQARREIVFVDADESEFLDYALAGFRDGSRTPFVALSADALEALEQVAIGYDEQRHPWMY